MADKKIVAKNGKYYLNKNQFFYVDRKKGRELLNQIKFPVLIMDTEFFNKSHDVENLDKKLYSDEDPDMIYTICYSIAKSFNDLGRRKNKEAISTISVKRKKGQKFDFVKHRDDLLKALFNLIIRKQIRTLIFAGESNDVKILNIWLDNHRSLLANKNVPLVFKDEEAKWSINSFDMYKELTQVFSFSNLTKDGKEFYPAKNLKKGNEGTDTIQIPSLAKFFDYFSDNWSDDDLEEKREIYGLCVGALKFYTKEDLTEEEFKKLSNVIRMVKKHCKNDVLKLLYLTNFVYNFVYIDDNENKFIKHNKKGN